MPKLCKIRIIMLLHMNQDRNNFILLCGPTQKELISQTQHHTLMCKKYISYRSRNKRPSTANSSDKSSQHENAFEAKRIESRYLGKGYDGISYCIHYSIQCDRELPSTPISHPSSWWSSKNSTNQTKCLQTNQKC